MNCIIIDDEEIARVIIAQMISNHKELNLVQEFSNAMQAIKYLNQNDVDLIFLDIHMPDFTGFDFIQTIKKGHAALQGLFLLRHLWRHRFAPTPSTQYSSLPYPMARFSKRVWFFWKKSFTVPVGPLRCLPIMTSATFGSLESLL